MICIENNSISDYYKEQTKPTWEKQGFAVTELKATVPSDLSQYSHLHFDLKNSLRNKRKVEFTDTEKAVWYSHFFAWQKCYAESKPAIIVEHDITLLREFEDEVFDYDIACLAHDRRKNGHEAKLAGGAYYITPKGAHKLSTIKNGKIITFNSDAWIHGKCDEIGKWFQHLARQTVNSDIGTTIEHRH